jgi:hypothetical protein
VSMVVTGRHAGRSDGIRVAGPVGRRHGAVDRAGFCVRSTVLGIPNIRVTAMTADSYCCLLASLGRHSLERGNPSL